MYLGERNVGFEYEHLKKSYIFRNIYNIFYEKKNYVSFEYLFSGKK